MPYPARRPLGKILPHPRRDQRGREVSRQPSVSPPPRTRRLSSESRPLSADSLGRRSHRVTRGPSRSVLGLAGSEVGTEPHARKGGWRPHLAAIAHSQDPHNRRSPPASAFDREAMIPPAGES